MSALQSMKDRASADIARRNPNQAIDPAMLDLIFNLIKEVIMLFQGCQASSDQASKMARRPSWWRRRQLKYLIYKNLGRKDYRKHGEDVYRAMRAAGRGTNRSEMHQAYQEV